MPRPIEPILDDVFYTFYRAPKQAREGEEGVHGPYRIEESGGGFDVVNDLGESKGHHETRDQAREQQKALYVNIPEAQEQAKADEKSKSSAIDPSNITQPNYYFVESVSGQTYTDTADLQGAIELADKLSQMKGEDFKVISQRGTEYHTGAGMTYGRRRDANLDNFGDKKAKPFGSEDDDDVDDDVDEFLQGGDKERGGGTGGFNDPSEPKKSSRRRRADIREQIDLGLRGDCEACVGTGELYAGEPCPACNGTGNKSGQPDQQPSRGTTWTPPNYQSSRRRKLIADDSPSTSGPSFTAPDSMRGGWKCSDCSADDLGVHDLNGHAEAHRQTTHRESYIGLFL